MEPTRKMDTINIYIIIRYAWITLDIISFPFEQKWKLKRWRYWQTGAIIVFVVIEIALVYLSTWCWFQWFFSSLWFSLYLSHSLRSLSTAIGSLWSVDEKNTKSKIKSYLYITRTVDYYITHRSCVFIVIFFLHWRKKKD